MKYLIGFVLGVLVSSLFFMWWMRSTANAPIMDRSEVTTNTEVLPEEFNSFYRKFHQDSTFQLAHITFPLEGIPPQADSSTIITGNYKWQKEDWVIHKDFDSQLGEFSKNRSLIGEGMIIEQITHNNGQFGMQRRFAKIGEEWYLIYYSAMNRITPQN